MVDEVSMYLPGISYHGQVVCVLSRVQEILRSYDIQAREVVVLIFLSHMVSRITTIMPVTRLHTLSVRTTSLPGVVMVSLTQEMANSVMMVLRMDNQESVTLAVMEL